MIREDLYKIKIDEVRIYPTDCGDTLFFVCPNDESKIFLHYLLFHFKREIIKTKNTFKNSELLSLFFKDFNYRIDLPTSQHTFKYAKSDCIEWLNTAIMTNGDFRTNLSEKISLNPL